MNKKERLKKARLYRKEQKRKQRVKKADKATLYYKRAMTHLQPEPATLGGLVKEVVDAEEENESSTQEDS